MKSIRKSSWQLVVVLILMSLTTLTCDGTPVPQTQSTNQDCRGDLYVEDTVVTRVNPQPDETYQLHSTYAWTAPPYGVEVTDSGQAIMQIYNASNVLLAKYSVFAAEAANGDVSVNKWDGFGEITFDSGNFIVEDSNSQGICNLDLIAGGVSVTSVGTKYVITVRPDKSEVVIAVLDGMLRVTSQGATANLDAKSTDRQLVVITNGQIGPLQPVPDPEKLLDDLIHGREIIPVIPTTPGSLTMWADEQLLPVLQELAKQFETDTGVNVQIEGMPINEIRDRFIVATDGGTPPDIMTLSHTQIYGLVGNGLLQPVEPGTNPDLLVPGTMQAFSVNGVNYGAPYMYANLALVSNPGYVTEIPSTWSALGKYAAELARGREFFTSLLIPADGYHFYPVQSAFGGYVFSDLNGDGRFDLQENGLDSTGSLEAASWLEQLVNSQPFLQGDEEAALQNFLGGNAAMIFTGPWALPRLRGGDMRYQINSFPGEVQDSQPFLDVGGFIISSASQASNDAQVFILNYLTTPDAMLAYSRILSAPPARRDALDRIEDPDLRNFGIAGFNGIPIPNIPEMQNVWGPWTEAIQYIIEGKKPADVAFTDAANQIRQSQTP